MARTRLRAGHLPPAGYRGVPGPVQGCGIPDVKKAREPLYTSVGGDRSGLGFSVMESFSDKLYVRSKLGVGTTVTMEKKISGKKYE